MLFSLIFLIVNLSVIMATQNNSISSFFGLGKKEAAKKAKETDYKARLKKAFEDAKALEKSNKEFATNLKKAGLMIKENPDQRSSGGTTNLSIIKDIAKSVAPQLPPQSVGPYSRNR